MSRKNELVFYWKAFFSDSSSIEQFDKKDNEVLFKEVLDKMNLLETFIITDDNEEYVVDLVDKTIETPYKTYTVVGKNPELIYFRRNSVRLEIGTGKSLPPSVVHHVGIKTDSDEKKVEIFPGQGMKPKEVKFNDIKKKKISKLN